MTETHRRPQVTDPNAPPTMADFEEASRWFAYAVAADNSANEIEAENALRALFARAIERGDRLEEAASETLSAIEELTGHAYGNLHENDFPVRKIRSALGYKSHARERDVFGTALDAMRRLAAETAVERDAARKVAATERRGRQKAESALMKLQRQIERTPVTNLRENSPLVNEAAWLRAEHAALRDMLKNFVDIELVDVKLAALTTKNEG